MKKGRGDERATGLGELKKTEEQLVLLHCKNPLSSVFCKTCRKVFCTQRQNGYVFLAERINIAKALG